MERYRFEESALRLMEASCIPFAVYQFVDRRVVTLALSQGFCDLFGFDDRDEAYFVMDNDMYRDTHPDDVSRIANAAVRFATEGGRYEVVYRSKAPGASEFSVVHSFGEHVYTPDGVRLAVVEGHGVNLAVARLGPEEACGGVLPAGKHNETGRMAAGRQARTSKAAAHSQKSL